MDTLIYQQHPVVEVASNKFENVPVIIQYEETPLLEVVRMVNAGFTTKIPIYHADGTYLAKVVGSDIYLTKDGTKAGITLRHPAGMTVCELGGKTVFEIRRTGAAALKAQAELYTPDGLFVKCTDTELAEYMLDKDKKELIIGSITMRNCLVSDCKIGILLDKKGGACMGVNR